VTPRAVDKRARPGPNSSTGPTGPVDQQEMTLMGIADKAKNAAEELAGKAKEVIGDLTDNKDLEAEGKTDQTKADVKNAGENLKDAFKK
jgi:uncharacterized protein YjbJ (UPF0337 family)